MVSKFLSIFLFLPVFLTLATPTRAVCPVCTMAIGGGVLLSRYLGVDDLIIGVWVGGLILSLGLWMASYIKKKYFPEQNWLVLIIFWLVTYLSFKKAGFIGHPGCKIFGYDKMLLGMFFGTLAFLAGYGIELLMRKFNKKNPGKVLFAYQRVAAPLFFLILMTFIASRLCSLV